MKSHATSQWFTALALVAAGFVIGGCAGKTDSEQHTPMETAQVQLYHIESGDRATETVLSGRVRAREEVTVNATVAGRVTALPIREGARFADAAVLVRFEAPEAERALAAARAAERAASFRAEEARLQETRMDSLYAAHVASKRERELAQLEARSATAAFEQARAQLAALETGTVVRAPFTGVMARHHVDVGADVQPGMPLVSIRSGGQHEIEVAIPGSQIEHARQADAWYQVGSSAWQAARVSRIEGTTDPSTRTRLAFLTPTERTALEPGTHVNVRFVGPAPTRPGGDADAPAAGMETPTHGLASGTPVMIPAGCVVRRGALRGVYVAHEGHAQLRWVRLGQVSGETIEVLAGVWPGEDVILSPADVEDGQPVATP